MVVILGGEEVGGSDAGERLLFRLSCYICGVLCETLYIDLMSCGTRCHLWPEFPCCLDHT